MNDSARPKRSDSAMGNGFDMELERKKEKLEAKNKLFNHSFHTYIHTYMYKV
jgi:hypothetical protein